MMLYGEEPMRMCKAALILYNGATWGSPWTYMVAIPSCCSDQMRCHKRDQYQAWSCSVKMPHMRVSASAGPPTVVLVQLSGSPSLQQDNLHKHQNL